MASNYFGQLFRITTFGESHGPAIGVVIDGCPAQLPISVEEINEALLKRRPGQSPYTSSRQETDSAEILSGVFEGKTTGAPIAILIRNQDVKSDSYESNKDLYRPGHANFTYLEKYGLFDYRGMGRASGRETAARVAAGAVAKKLLKQFDIECIAYIEAIEKIAIREPIESMEMLKKKLDTSQIFCPDHIAEKKMIRKIQSVKKEGDSLGGIVACYARLPAGLGDPIFYKIEATLAHAMLSIPATKGFEIGCGFRAATMKGSVHNDPFDIDQGKVCCSTNQSGGTLGGISNGSPLYFRVAFKPTPGIKKEQETVSIQKNRKTLQLPDNDRHDPCVAIRAVSVVEAMTAICLADALLMNRSARI